MIRLRIQGAALLLAALAAAPAGAQSLLSASSLGYPLDPVDARARGLGGVGVGLPEPQLSLVNPAALAGLPAAGLSVTLQSDAFSQDAGAGQVTTARFPAIQAAFPIGPKFVASIGYAALLDQNWQSEIEDSLDVGGERRFVRDRFVSRGGLSRFRAGAAYTLVPRVDVGVGIDLYTGALRDTVSREFPDGGLFPAIVGTDYEYDGVGASVGARYRGPALTVSAAVTAAGDLTAEPADSAAEARTYALPLTLDAGASARVSQNALVAASFRWSRWSGANEALEQSGGARDVMQAGAGVEYEGLRLLGRPFPVRLGARWAQLPFSPSEALEFPQERALTGGFGLLLAGGAAAADVSVERGTRDGGDPVFDENFWRVSLSLRLLGR
jgi:long-subunit fatty acid transport protein